MIDTKLFRARTEFNKEERIPDTGAWTVAADIGYSGVKGMNPAGHFCFPSYAVRIDGDRGMLGEADPSYILYTDLETGAQWAIGKYAQDRISDRDTSVTEEALFGRERYDDPMFRVLIRTALGFGMDRGRTSPDGRKLVIQTGYPPAYQADSEDLISAFAGEHHFSLRRGNLPAKDYHIRADRNQVFLMAQPMGTLFSVMVGNEGVPVPGMSKLLKKNVLVFDAGFGTLDLFPVRGGHLEQNFSNPKLGMRRVMQETCMALKSSGVDVGVPALQKYLEDGYARFHTRKSSKKVELCGILEECSEKICLEAVDWMTQGIPVYEYDYLIITGGAGDAWYDKISEALKDMETLKILRGNENDRIPMVYANVRGYYLYRAAKSLSGKGGART